MVRAGAAMSMNGDDGFSDAGTATESALRGARCSVAGVLVLLLVAMSACRATHDTGQRDDADAPMTDGAAPQQPTTRADARPTTSPQDDAPVRAFPGITVAIDRRRVEVEARSCLEEGPLEQIACAPGTREHESLLVITARPSDIHAALLLVGLEPGRPGSWTWNEETRTVSFDAPRGDRVGLTVRYERNGQSREHGIGDWMIGPSGERFPLRQWIFAGSQMAPNLEWMGPGEHYVADMSGSIVGLVTFGDEVLGFEEVLPDQEDVQSPQWFVRAGAVPPLDTPVTLVIDAAR